ncbi:DUF4391 domain-containing protein [Acidovorax sp. sic0104]|uniref:DUF4391 domain-containing protein n=1 Tax=Acidovorax sp. sic0104 TaxID=2854784 RepID=UPI001C445AB8|nr:DUF4391 domain-containing protein [Acidovorax sp. sic0104]MBV7544621.1 DUF4391 domain-containing protein [Acidovorax sp. sic0104]
MSAIATAHVLAALALPDATRVDQRVPKKLLAERGAATAADKRQVQDGVDEVQWLASLKPHLIGVPAFKDAQREYLEVAVLSLKLKPGTKPGRLAELLHRAVPYPMLLVTSSDLGVNLSLAHIRASQNEADKMVLDGPVLSVPLPEASRGQDFYAAMALAKQPQANLLALYQGWLDTAGALDIAAETGRFQRSMTREQAAARQAALQDCRQLKAQIAQLRSQADKERQIARQVALNQEIHDAERQLLTLQCTLSGEAA